MSEWIKCMGKEGTAHYLKHTTSSAQHGGGNVIALLVMDSYDDDKEFSPRYKNYPCI